MKKRGLVILAVFLVLFSFSANSLTADLNGVNICNVPRNCEPIISDGICPEDFAAGRVCAVQDIDCKKCVINKAAWSKSDTTFEAATEVKSGVPVYMYVETTGCDGKDATFELFGVGAFSNTKLSLGFAGKVTGAKVTKEVTFIFNDAYSILGADSSKVFNKFKFNVNII